jgi:hypothetical protein
VILCIRVQIFLAIRVMLQHGNEKRGAGYCGLPPHKTPKVNTVAAVMPATSSIRRIHLFSNRSSQFDSSDHQLRFSVMIHSLRVHYF